MKRFNVNKFIKVKLTPRGVDIYYHQNDELNKWIKENGGLELGSRMPKIDENGYTEFQLWNFMNLYGKYFVMGSSENVIEDLSIYIEDGDLEEVVSPN